ncbi:MAG: hypothetical protein RI963_3707 [Planctomycetota bacterium]|jgi:hypothetical protein
MPGPHSVADTPARAVTILDGSTGRLAPNATHFVYSELDSSEGFGFFRF